jgi:nitroreductase
MDEFVTLVVTVVVVTATTTALVLIHVLGYKKPSAISVETPPPLTQPSKSPLEILGEQSGWADPKFVAKYNEGRDTPEGLKGANDAPSKTASLIRTRRSIFPKDFTDINAAKVDLSIVEECLAAANWAPTHGKTEPWRFVVAGPETVERVMDIRDDFMSAKLTEKGDTEGLEKHKSKMAKKRKELKNCSVVVFIVVARVPNSKGSYMPEWEEIAAVSCAVQNFHLQVTARWSEGVGGYWSSGGYDSWMQAPEFTELLGAKDNTANGAPDRDLVLGGFYLGVCPPEKMSMYRSKRGDMSDKVQWLY